MEYRTRRFSEEQREFNSKAQKALRAKYEQEKFDKIAKPELREAWDPTKKKQAIKQLDKTSALIEKLDSGQGLTKSDLLNASINSKAEMSGSLASSTKVVPGDKWPKKKLKGHTYDHGSTTETAIKTNKDVMKTFKSKDQLNKVNSVVSIKKHQDKIKEIRGEHKIGSLIHDAKKVIKKNPRAVKAGIGVTAAAGLAYTGKKIYDKTKKNKKD